MLLYSHNLKSKGAKRLSRELNIKRIKHHNSRFTGLGRPWVVNWGYSGGNLPWEERVRFLNAPRDVEITSNKLWFFEMMDNGEDAIIPVFTTEIEIAQEWKNNGMVVVERHLLRGSMGNGIRLVGRAEEIWQAPLYTQYIKKAHEYRVHVFEGKTIDIQRKAKREGFPEANFKIRTLANGFIYRRQNVEIPQEVIEVALQTMQASGLLFGAVDVIWNNRREKAYVLEINTAPGLEGQTVKSYANAIRAYIKQ